MVTISLTAAQVLSVVAYIVPTAVLLVARSRRDRPLWEIALDIPTGVALDLLSVLALTRFMTLETSVLVSRPAWLLGGAAFMAWRWRARRVRPRWPSALGRPEVLTAVFAGAFAFLLCSFISRTYMVWDAQWHMPLVTSLSPQKLPFANALSPREVLHYHFSGDVLAAVQQTLSFGVISSIRALAAAHDIMFVATAITLALLLMSLGLRRRWTVVLTAAAVLLQGPIPIRGGIGGAFFGYAYNLFFNLSYRPHVPIATLLLVGFLGTIVVRLNEPRRIPARRTVPVLLATVALLAITDETSTALFGFALGVTWLFHRDVIGGSRIVGLAILIALAALVVGVNVAFSASLAPGSPVQKISRSEVWQWPGVKPGTDAIPLSKSDGRMALVIDMLPLVACWLGISLHTFRRRRDVTAPLALFSGIVVAVGGVVATRILINENAAEAQRLFVAPFFAAVVFAVLLLHRMTPGSTERFLVLLGTAVPAVITAYWLWEVVPQFMSEHKAGARDWLQEDLFESNCRVLAGAHWGDVTRPTYIEHSQLFRYASCRPVFFPGTPDGPWPTKIQPHMDPISALRVLDTELVARDTELDAVCRAGEGPNDVVCTRALRVRSSCRPAGTAFLRCPLTPADREALLGTR